MDIIGKTPMALPSLTKITREFEKRVKEETTKTLRNVLSDISEKYGIAQNELFSNYLSDEIVIDSIVTDSKPKRTKKSVPDTDQCTALVSNGLRCSRRRKEGALYCGSHIVSRSFGEITQLSPNERDEKESLETPEAETTKTKITISKK